MVRYLSGYHVFQEIRRCRVRLETRLHEAEAPVRSDEDMTIMDEAEYIQWRTAAIELTGKRGADAVTNWRKFLDNLGLQQGVYWSPLERQQFRERFENEGLPCR